MIKRWLVKHRWVNEAGKLVAAGFFAYIALVAYRGAEVVSIVFDSLVAFKLLVGFGVVIGMMGLLSLLCIIDVIFSIIDILRKKIKGYK